MEYDSDGRPKGISEIFENVKKDYGEQQSEQFKLFYDILSNQIKYCLAPYLSSQDKESSSE